jgi:hypothetical protein
MTGRHEHVRTYVLLAVAVGCFAYAFADGNPAWIGTGGALVGGEALWQAKPAGGDA